MNKAIVSILKQPGLHLTGLILDSEGICPDGSFGCHSPDWEQTRARHWAVPEVVTGGGQEDAMSLDGFVLHHQHHIEEDAAVPERHQPAEQGLRVLCTAVSVAAALLWGRLQGSFVCLSQLLILRHPRQKCSATSCSRMKSVRQQNRQRFVPFALQTGLWPSPVTENKATLQSMETRFYAEQIIPNYTENRQMDISTPKWHNKVFQKHAFQLLGFQTNIRVFVTWVFVF